MLHADDAYYVLKCTDDYDEDETAARKERIYEERKTRLSGDLRPVQQYDLRFLQQRALGPSGSTSEFEKNDADFFEIYAEYAIK